MVGVAKKFAKTQITIRVHPQNLQKLDELGEVMFRNRSEMVDRAIEEFVRRHAGELESEPERPITPHRPRR